MSSLQRALSFYDDRGALRADIASDIERGNIPVEKIQHLPLELLDVTRIPNVTPTNILVPSPAYKPFRYPPAYETYLTQNKVHWLPEEVPLSDDVRDWHRTLTEAERNLVAHIFRLFTQNDDFVNNVYLKHYAKVFGPSEVLMAIGAISNIESTHQAAYSYLLDTIGMPETEYSAFMSYKAMSDKYDYMQSFKTNTLFGLALAMVIFGGIMEGVQLFASFAMLMNFQRDKKGLAPSTMKGMGQIVTWSQRDESLHCAFVAYLFRSFMDEFHPVINKPALFEAIIASTKQIIKNEHHFIDLAFEMGPVPGMTAQETKDYVEFMADKRLEQFGLPKISTISKNPIPWVESEANSMEFASLFEQRGTNYSRGATQGTWEEAFASWKSTHRTLANQ